MAFPILVDRLLTELAGAALPPDGLVVGDALPVEPGAAARSPRRAGRTTEVVPGGPGPSPTAPGLLDDRQPRAGPSGVVAVNVDPAESAHPARARAC